MEPRIELSIVGQEPECVLRAIAIARFVAWRSRVPRAIAINRFGIEITDSGMAISFGPMPKLG